MIFYKIKETLSKVKKERKKNPHKMKKKRDESPRKKTVNKLQI